MSNNNGNDPNKVRIVCPSCSTVFSAKPPAIEYSNSKYSSVITASHETLITCIACGQKFLFYIADVNPAAISWGAGALSEEGVMQFEGSQIVKPPSGLIVP